MRRDRDKKIHVIIPWMAGHTAFTAPGSYIFISRNLFQLCRTEDMLAMIVAHEMAHHDPGHLDSALGWLDPFTSLGTSALAFGLVRNLVTRIFGPEQECDADRHAIELCLDAGYSGEKCIELFDILERHALDMRDLGMVFGPDERDNELDGTATWYQRLRMDIYYRRRGYLPIRDRRALLIEHVKSLDLE